MSDETAGTQNAAQAGTPAAPAASGDLNRQERRDLKAREQLAKTRAENERLRAQIEEFERKSSDAQSAAAAQEIAKARQEAEAGRDALRYAEFTRVAIEQGVRPDRVQAAYKLADLSGVSVDLTARTADGIEDAVQSVLDTLPELMTPTQQDTNTPRPRAATPAPGRKPSTDIDLTNLKPGDITRLQQENPEQYAALMKQGIRVPLKIGGGRTVMVPVSGTNTGLRGKIEDARRRAGKA